MKKLVLILTILSSIALCNIATAGTWEHSWKFTKGTTWTERTGFDYKDSCTPDDRDSISCDIYAIAYSRLTWIDGVKFFIRTSNQKFKEISWDIHNISYPDNGGFPDPVYASCHRTNSGANGREISPNVFQYYCADEVHFTKATLQYTVARVTYQYQNGVQREREYWVWLVD
jgi:hypothetical protein